MDKQTFEYKIRLSGKGGYVNLSLDPNEYEALNTYLVNNSSLENGLRCFSKRKIGERVRNDIEKALETYGESIRYQFIGKKSII